MDTKPTNPKDTLSINKVAMHTVPPRVLLEIALGLGEGARKYGSFNYREAGVRASVYFDGLMRHVLPWWEGEDLDPDSGLSHITKAITDLIVLRDSMIEGNWVDDRPPAEANTGSYMAPYNEAMGKINAKYPNAVPPFTQARRYNVGAGKYGIRGSGTVEIKNHGSWAKFPSKTSPFPTKEQLALTKAPDETWRRGDQMDPWPE